MKKASGRHEHGASCDCPAHRARAPRGASHAPAGSRGWLASLLPALACAVCPACLTTYAKALSVAGMSAWLSERGHLAFLVVAVALSLGFGLRRARSLQSYRPFAFTALGCALLVAGHLFGESPPLTWAGLVALFVGGVYGQRLHLRLVADAHAPASFKVPGSLAKRAPRPGRAWRIVGQKNGAPPSASTTHH